jgi:molybdate transport system substrate-binding protein
MAMKQSFAILALLLASAGCQSSATPAPAPAAPAAVRVLSSNGVRAAMEALKPQLEQAIGHPLSIEFSTSAAFKTKIDGGEPFDVTILTPALVDDLVKSGKVAGDSRVNVGRVGVGVGSKAGAPKADVSTPEALKKMLLASKSVAFTADGASRATIDKAFAKLGITSQMTPKFVLKGPGEGPHAVAQGEAEIVMTLASEIAPEPGVQLLGMLPSEVQGYVGFTAGRSAAAKEVEGANALLKQFSEPSVLATMKANLVEAPVEDTSELTGVEHSFAEAVAKADAAAAAGMLDDEATWTDANGRTVARAALTKSIPKPAVDDASAQVKHFVYGPVGVVQIDKDRVHAVRVWVKRPAGWRLLVHQEVESLPSAPTTTPGTGKECVNPCKSVPYEAKSDSERAVIAAYQELETSSHAADASTWGKHVADEFVVVSSNSDKVLDKETRLAGLRKSSFGGVSPTALVSAKMFDFGDVVVMLAQHKPEKGNPLQIARVWINRNGVWQSTLSYQTSIKSRSDS